jgi:hypothetical protein
MRLLMFGGCSSRALIRMVRNTETHSEHLQRTRLSFSSSIVAAISAIGFGNVVLSRPGRAAEVQCYRVMRHPQFGALEPSTPTLTGTRTNEARVRMGFTKVAGSSSGRMCGNQSWRGTWLRASG